MPFNQQMTFPVELSLRTFREGVRLCRQPVRELALLNDRPHHWRNETLGPGRRIVPPTQHDLFNVTASIDLGSAATFGFVLRGIDLRYHVAEQKFTYLGRDVPAAATNGTLELQILLDRTSLELFAGHGKSSASFCFLPEAWDAPIEVYAEGGSVTVNDLLVRELSSIWG
jgi:sucrose-6-phosphate hydrolase SacC (GH32 family)